MSKQTYISRYLKIISFLRQRRATFEEINAHLAKHSEIEGYNYQMSQRTFQRDLNEIRNIYSIDIQCRKTTGEYFIAEEEDLSDNQHLLASFDLFNALRLTGNYTDLIQFENTNVKGSEHIYYLLQAIKNKTLTEIVYKKFYEDESEKVLIEPYLLKQFKAKWYVVSVKSQSQEVRTYALDRILKIDVKRKKFVPGGILNLSTYSNNSFGIINPVGQKIETIIFSFDSEQANYIKHFPIHRSQVILQEAPDSVTFQIEVFITYDLIAELLSYGEGITIQSPKKLIKELKASYSACLKKYQD